MERVVRVRDLKQLPSGFDVFLELRDLLPLFVPEGHAWLWSLRTVPELVADERWDLNVPFIEAAVERSARGLTLSFDELEQFGGRVSQVIWGEFVAAGSESTLPLSSASPADVGRDAIAGLLAIDSTYWIVGGPAVVIDRVVAAFSEVDELSTGDWIAAEG